MALLRAEGDRAAQTFSRTGGGKGAFLGLEPHQLQNFSFQINDIFTQLASGTSLTQTLAQQGGQLIQIFPRVGSAIASGLTSGPVLAIVAAIGTLIIALKSAADRAQALRTLQGLLAATAQEGKTSAESLRAVAKELDRYGLSAEDALTITRQLFQKGFDPARITEFGLAIKDMTDVLGGDLKSNADLVTEAFTGNFEALDKLMRQTNAFTPAQQAMIRDLYAQGRAAEGAEQAFRIFSWQMEEGARQARGPWTEAIRNVGNAWDTFATSLGDSMIGKAALAAVNGLAGALSGLANVLNGNSSAWERLLMILNPGAAIGVMAGRGIAGGSSASGAQSRLPSQQALQLPSASAGTAEQQANAERLRRETERRAAAEGQITSEKDIQRRLDAIATAEYERLGNTVTQAVAQEHVAGLVARERIKLEEQLAQHLKQQADEQERRNREAQSFMGQTRSLLQDLERFRPKAYWDVNAFRAGFGSDTVTRADGRIEHVTANTTVTRDDAVRDLERRIGEFADVVKGQIGTERFNDFSPQQQAALTSIAYNYGSLPDRILAAVRTGTSEQIAEAVRGLGGDNGGINRARRNREADLLNVPNLAVEQSAEEAQQRALDKQKEYNDGIAAENLKRQQTIGLLQAQQGLTGQALIDEQKRQFIEEAVSAQRAKALKDGLTYSAEQEAATRALAAQEFELTRGIEARAAARKEDLQKQREAVDAAVAAYQAQQQALQQQIQFLRENGQGSAADALLPQLDAVNAKLLEAINRAKALYEAFANSPEALAALGATREQIQAIIGGLNTASQSTQQLGTFMGISLGTIAEQFASGAASAIDRFAQAVAEGKDVMGSLRDAFLQFASDFLRKIAQMIEQQIIFNLVRSLLSSIGGGATSVAGGGVNGALGLGALGGALAHGGGIIQRTMGANRQVSPAWFQNAMRYHGGGIAGLRPDEVPAILQRGEEVLTREDPRHRLNGGGAGGPVNLKVVNAIDAGDMYKQGLASKVGEKAFLNFIRDNAGAVRQALG
jgi:GH24 family phage-related lysozyme (muramidase)